MPNASGVILKERPIHVGGTTAAARNVARRVQICFGPSEYRKRSGNHTGNYVGQMQREESLGEVADLNGKYTVGGS